jgi:hypothetical protein
MKIFAEPQMEVILLDGAEDIITQSLPFCDTYDIWS